MANQINDEDDQIFLIFFVLGLPTLRSNFATLLHLMIGGPTRLLVFIPESRKRLGVTRPVIGG